MRFHPSPGKSPALSEARQSRSQRTVWQQYTQMWQQTRLLVRRPRGSVALGGRRAISTNKARKTIFSGIQPTGTPHLGNYAGAIRQWVQLQSQPADTCQLIYSVVDLHAITVPQQAQQLRQWKKETLAALLAAGIDPARSTLFYQSSVRVLNSPSHPPTLTHPIFRCRPIQNSCGF